MTNIGAAWTTLPGTTLNEFDGDVMKFVAKLRQRTRVLTSNGHPISEAQKVEIALAAIKTPEKAPAEYETIRQFAIFNKLSYDELIKALIDPHRREKREAPADAKVTPKGKALALTNESNRPRLSQWVVRKIHCRCGG